MSAAVALVRGLAEARRGAVGLRCSACGGTERLRPYSPWHRIPICNPCFIVWYDPDEAIDVTDPAQVGALSLKLKAAGKYPWGPV